MGVSFLVDFLPNQGPYDWEVGTHGIILNLTRNNRKYDATFLPEVAAEEEWDKKTTLKHLLKKAGCNIPLSIKIMHIMKIIHSQNYFILSQLLMCYPYLNI